MIRFLSTNPLFCLQNYNYSNNAERDLQLDVKFVMILPNFLLPIFSGSPYKAMEVL